MNGLPGKIGNRISQTENVFSLILICLMTLLVWLQILSRVSGRSIQWSEEMSRYLLVWMVFFGSAVGVRTKSHIGASFLVAALKGKKKLSLILFQNIVFLSFFSLLGYYSIPFIQMQKRFGQTAETLPIPMYMITAIVPVSCILALYHLFGEIIALVRALRAPLDESEV